MAYSAPARAYAARDFRVAPSCRARCLKAVLKGTTGTPPARILGSPLTQRIQTGKRGWMPRARGSGRCRTPSWRPQRIRYSLRLIHGPAPPCGKCKCPILDAMTSFLCMATAETLTPAASSSSAVVAQANRTASGCCHPEGSRLGSRCPSQATYRDEHATRSQRTYRFRSRAAGPRRVLLSR